MEDRVRVMVLLLQQVKNTRHLVAAGVHVLKMISYSNEFFIQAVFRKESRVLQAKKYKMARRQLSLWLRRAPACYVPATRYTTTNFPIYFVALKCYTTVYLVYRHNK